MNEDSDGGPLMAKVESCCESLARENNALVRRVRALDQTCNTLAKERMRLAELVRRARLYAGARAARCNARPACFNIAFYYSANKDPIPRTTFYCDTCRSVSAAEGIRSLDAAEFLRSI